LHNGLGSLQWYQSLDSCQPVGISRVTMNMDIVNRIEECASEYETINNFRGLLTFQWFLSYENPSWNKKKIVGWLKAREEIRAAFGRNPMPIGREKQRNPTPIRREKQRNPTPIRSTQRCYSCKVPWEPDHRCRGKGKTHIVEVREDNNDEACEDGSIEAYLEQSDDESDSCIEASDSDSCTEDEATSTLEEDDDPCVVDRQLDGQDDSTSVSTYISHTIDDLTPQQSGDTSEDSHMLAPRDDELPMMAMTHMSSFQTPLIATSHEEVGDMSDMIEEPCVRDAHHGQADP
jgi:hypothetical protein